MHRNFQFHEDIKDAKKYVNEAVVFKGFCDLEVPDNQETLDAINTFAQSKKWHCMFSGSSSDGHRLVCISTDGRVAQEFRPKNVGMAIGTGGRRLRVSR